MEKNRILSKLNIDIKDYNNELEKILENKLFSYEVKNLLLSMLYKIENAYKDYETVKVEVPSKGKFIENILRIIEEKTLMILLVKPETPEAKELEKNKLKYKLDKENGEIVCFENEMVMLAALLKLDETEIDLELPYEYMKEPLNILINQGKLDSSLEVIRDFNGWSWDIVVKEIGDIEFNLLYQIILLLNGENCFNNKEYEEVFEDIAKMAIQKHLSNEENKEYIKKFEKIKASKNEKLSLFNNKKEFLNQITQEKKKYIRKINKIDKILNNSELLKKEYYKRNEKLANKDKIFSVSYLAEIMENERTQLLEKIEECNKIILPKEFVERKSELEKEIKFLEDISYGIKKENIIKICKKFLGSAQETIKKIDEENKNKLIEWIYKIRYFRHIPISKKETTKDIQKLNFLFEEIINLIIKKAEEFKVWDNFTEDRVLAYKVLEEVFNSKIIYLQNINIKCKYEEKILYVEYYDDTIIDTSKEINIISVKIKKKFKLFI